MHAVMFFFLFKEFYRSSYNNSKKNMHLLFGSLQNSSKSNGTVKSSSNEKKSEDVNMNAPASNIINSNKASDYYIKSEDLPSTLTQRHVAEQQ